jgi:thiol-disulfide isomerase/thioredoxin
MKTVVYAFGATWCSSCKAFKPTFEQWAELHADKANFVSVDIDLDKETMKAFRVTTLPAVVIAHDGREIMRFVGPPSEADLLSLLTGEGP